jgi:hypothetical protein
MNTCTYEYERQIIEQERKNYRYRPLGKLVGFEVYVHLPFSLFGYRHWSSRKGAYNLVPEISREFKIEIIRRYQ